MGDGLSVAVEICEKYASPVGYFWSGLDTTALPPPPRHLSFNFPYVRDILHSTNNYPPSPPDSLSPPDLSKANTNSNSRHRPPADSETTPKITRSTKNKYFTRSILNDSPELLHLSPTVSPNPSLSALANDPQKIEYDPTDYPPQTIRTPPPPPRDILPHDQTHEIPCRNSPRRSTPPSSGRKELHPWHRHLSRRLCMSVFSLSIKPEKSAARASRRSKSTSSIGFWHRVRCRSEKKTTDWGMDSEEGSRYRVVGSVRRRKHCLWIHWVP